MAELCELINTGGKFNLDEIGSKPVLFHAAKSNLPLVVRRLFDAGLDLNITDDEGKTAVFYANRNHSMDALAALIARGVEFRLNEIDGKALLFYVAKNDCWKIVQKLGFKNFDLNITDDEGKTAVYYANRFKSMKVLCELICLDAEFKPDEIDGKAVLFYAAKEHSWWKVVQKLHSKNFDLSTTDDEGKTAVFYANRNHSLKTLYELIRCDAEFSLDEIDGKALLFYAAKYNLPPIVVSRLFDAGLDLNITDDEGKTAVFYANRNHSMDALCELIYCGAEFRLREIDGKALLFYASQQNFAQIVQKLHFKNFDLNITDDEGKTAMFYANRNHSMDALCELIECDAEFKLDKIDGKALLFYAARNDWWEIVKKLHFKNFDLNITDDEGETAVYYANRYKSMKVLCELICLDAEFNLDEIDGKAVLFYAAKEHSWRKVVQKLHSKNFDLNTTDDEGNTAVFYANRNHNLKTLYELIRCDAEFSLDEIDGKALLFYAAKYNLPPIVVSRLFDAGLDLNITDDEGKTAVFYANRNHSMDALCELIYCGAEFRLREIDGKALLFYASQQNFAQIVQKLHFKNFDLNITDDEGKTAVFYANRNHSMDALCELIECDAEFKLDKIDGKALLFYAARNDWWEIVQKLHFKNFLLDITDDEGKTAVYYASRNHSLNVLYMLIRCDAEFKLDEIDGKALLFYAAQNNLRKIVQKLHFKNFDLNITDDESKTAVFYANLNHSMDALSELIARDADFKLDDEIDGKDLLFHAAKNNDFVVVKKLHDKNFNLNITDDEGKTALFYANRNHSMDALCALIDCGAEFKLGEINGKAVLFHAAKNQQKCSMKALYDAGLDLNITDEQGKTVVFYANKDLLDTLMQVTDVFLDDRDNYGRTPLFHALQENDTTKARYLIKKGANLQLKDNCNGDIFTFFVEICISGKVEQTELFTSHLFKQKKQRKALSHAIFNILYCQAPLLCVSTGPDTSPRLLKSRAIFNKTNILKALAFAKKHCLTRYASSIACIAKNIRENAIYAPRILSLLINLGADPQIADTDGNTAFHYATLLPFYGVSQGDIMAICKYLRKCGTFLNARNHRHESPLLFCLSSNAWKVVTESNKWQSSISGLVEVCRFLLNKTNVLRNTESIFQRIISLIQQGLELNEKAKGKAVVEVLVDILELLQPDEEAVRNAVNYTDTLSNSPLHLWASIALKTHQDYTGFGTEDFTFEKILKRTLVHLLKCGVQPNARNVHDETPLHRCTTWTALKLLLDAGANPNDQNSLGHSPLLAAAKKNNALGKSGHLYPDVTEDPGSFWRTALEKKLNPWILDNQGETLLNVLIQSEDFALTRGLIQVACEEESTKDHVKLSILNAICNDESKHTHWKIILVDMILKSAGTNRLALESPLRLCCRNIARFGMFDERPGSVRQRANDMPSHNDSVHCKIAKRLRQYRQDTDIAAIVKEYPFLEDFLKETIPIDTMPIVISWASVSHKRKGILTKVARNHECKTVEQVLYHKHHIGRGSFGFIFAGINTKDGREVAVKRIEINRVELPEYKREIDSLVALGDCEHVVRYISFHEDGEFYYLVLELMEGNLEEFFDEHTFNAAEITGLCEDVVLGLQFLHEQKILHRDLKPQNILYKVHPKMCLKIADFGLSRTIDSKCTTVYSAIAGTRCWIAPEVLKSDLIDKNRFATESDVFSCGMLLHYILSGRKHPFSPTDCANKNSLQVSHETDANIMNGKMDGWDNSLFPEATHLLKRMLESDKKERPSAALALKHPLFWSNKRKVDFLEVVGNQKEFQCPRSKRPLPSLTQVETDLEKCFSTIVKRKNWNNSANMNSIYLGMITKKRRNYDTSSSVELVRFIRNTYEHYRDNTFVTTIPIERMLFNDFVFLKSFPDLVIEVYKAVTTHDWDKTRDDITCFLNDTNTK